MWWNSSLTLVQIGHWVRLNYATTHHPPPPPTTTHHQQKYIHHHPPPPTTAHHQPKYIHHHPPPPKKWTITQQKIKYIHILLFWHCFNSFYFFEMQYFHDGDFLWSRFDQLVFRIQNLYYILRYLRFFENYISRV